MKVGVLVAAIAAGIGVAAVAVGGAPALPALLWSAFAVVYGACLVGGVLLWRMLRPARSVVHVKSVKVHVKTLPARRREIPAAARAIAAPRVIVVTPADVLATPTPRPPAGRTAGRG